MARSKETFNKKEREKKKQKQKEDKQEKKMERRASGGSKSLDDMLAYVDENGNLSSSPPVPRKQKDREESIEHLYTGIPVREPESAERHGRIDFFNEEKGFGFIKDANSQERIFVHVSQLTEPLQDNDKVSFQTERGPRGLTAVQVKKMK